MTGNENPKIGGLLLAAGGSSRFGSPKQLARFDGKTLIRRAAEALTGSACDPVVVVLGAEIDQSQAETEGLSLTVYVNEEWQTGMSSSIKSGLAELLRIEPELAAVVIALCDQPHVTSTNIDQLIAAFRSSSAPIVAAEYAGIIGVPALFGRVYFEEVSTLTEDKGAQQIIRNHSDQVRTIGMEKAGFDIDTPDDVDRNQTHSPNPARNVSTSFES